MVTTPISAASSQGWGVGSLLRGVGKGVLGALTKPVSGAVDLVSHTSQGILTSTGLARGPVHVRPATALMPTADTGLRVRYKLMPLLRRGLQERALRTGSLLVSGCYYLFHAPVLNVHEADGGVFGNRSRFSSRVSRIGRARLRFW